MKKKITLPVGLFLAPSIVLASGFQLMEQSASGQGTSYAGSAAVAEDATTIFSNPAGMALLPQDKKSFAVSLSAVQPSAKFSNQGSVAPTLQALGGNTGGDAGDLAFIPSAYFSMPLNKDINIGFAINAPFGLKTEYDSDWQGRFHGIKSDVKTVNLNPSISYRASDTVTLGFGVDYQRLTGEFTSAVNYAASVFQAASAPAAAGGLGLPAATAAGLATAAGQGTAKITGSDNAWGYNFGALFQLTPATRLGLSYRSTVKYHLTGNADFSRTASGTVNAILGSAASAARGGDIYADIKLPDTFTASTVTRLNDQWDVMADLAWTGWAKIPDLTFRYANNSSVVSTTPENWRNTLRAAVGAVHRYNDAWKVRVGMAYDQSPVKDDYRTVRLPDNNRTWLSIGGQYKPSKDSAIDFGYSHLFVKDGPMRNNGGSTAGYGMLLGTYEDKVDILSIQYSVAF